MELFEKFVRIALAIIVAFTLAALMALLLFFSAGSYWAASVLEKKFAEQCVDAGDGLKRRVDRVTSWYERGGPSFSFNSDYQLVARGKIWVSRGTSRTLYDTSQVNNVSCE